MRLVKLTLLLLSVSVMAFAQASDSKATIQKVNALVKKDQIEDAKKILQEAIAQNPSDMVLQERMGRICYSQDNGEREAIPYFVKVVEAHQGDSIKTKSILEVQYFLSQSYYLNGQYDEALEMLTITRTQVPKNQVGLIQKLDQEIEQLKSGIELKKNPLQFKSTNLGNMVNSPYEDHSPVVAFDETRLIFTSTRPINKNGDKETQSEDELTEGIWETLWDGNNWGAPKALFSGINNQSNNATCSMDFDGTTLYFYRNENGKGDIYTTKLNERNEWSNPEKLPKPINSGYNENHAAISADGSMLFFTSDRPGGLGGLDIYVVRRLPNGEWSKEQNLGLKVNTDKDDEAPFFHADGVTLFYSSRGHYTSGGYDIFKTTLSEDGVWSSSENIGYPINTPDDDLFYQPTVDGQRVYYVSHKNTGAGASDLYLLEFLDTDRRSMSVVSCSANSVANDSSINATLIVKEFGSESPVGTYKCNPANGKFIVILPVGKEYTFEFQYEGYKSVVKEVVIPKRIEYVTTRKIITLDPIEFTELDK